MKVDVLDFQRLISIWIYNYELAISWIIIIIRCYVNVPAVCYSCILPPFIDKQLSTTTLDWNCDIEMFFNSVLNNDERKTNDISVRTCE